MNHDAVSSVLRWIAAAGFVANAAWHASGYRSVTQLAAQGPPPLQPLIATLWLAFSASLVVLGLIVGLGGRRPHPHNRLILVVAAFFPIIAAVLQVRFLGFIPPTASLIGLGLLTLASAAIRPAGRQHSAPSAA